MRSTPSDQTMISLRSLAARWRATDSRVLRSRPTQFGAIDATCDDDAAFVDDADDAAGRQVLDPKCILEVLEHGADRQHRAQSARLILHRSRDRHHPFAERTGAHDVADREAPTGQDLPEVFAIADREAPGLGGCPDIGAIEREQQDIGDVGRQFRLDPSQQRVIGGDIGRIGGYRCGSGRSAGS